MQDATEAAVDALLDWAGGPAWTPAAFTALAAKMKPHLNKAVRDVVVAAEQALRAADAAGAAIDAAAGAVRGGGSIADLVTDMRAQLAVSLAPGFISRTGAAALPDLTRRLQALQVRAERVVDAPARDRGADGRDHRPGKKSRRGAECPADRAAGRPRCGGGEHAPRGVPGRAVRAADANIGPGLGQADPDSARRTAPLNVLPTGRCEGPRSNGKDVRHGASRTKASRNRGDRSVPVDRLYRPVRRYPDRVHHHTAGVTRLVVTRLVVTGSVVTGPPDHGHAAAVRPAVGRITNPEPVGCSVDSVRRHLIDGVGPRR